MTWLLFLKDISNCCTENCCKKERGIREIKKPIPIILVRDERAHNRCDKNIFCRYNFGDKVNGIC